MNSWWFMPNELNQVSCCLPIGCRHLFISARSCLHSWSCLFRSVSMTLVWRPFFSKPCGANVLRLLASKGSYCSHNYNDITKKYSISCNCKYEEHHLCGVSWYPCNSLILRSCPTKPPAVLGLCMGRAKCGKDDSCRIGRHQAVDKHMENKWARSVWSTEKFVHNSDVSLMGESDGVEFYVEMQFDSFNVTMSQCHTSNASLPNHLHANITLLHLTHQSQNKVVLRICVVFSLHP